MKTPDRRTAIIDRIYARVKVVDTGYRVHGVESPCHLWQGTTSGNGRGGGYGRITINNITCATHRVSYTHFYGTIPAVIAEVVKRAKLVQLGLQEPGTKVENITGEALYQSALSMQDQITLLAEQSKKKVVEPTFNEVIGGAVTAQLAPVISQIEEMQRVSLRLGKLIP